MEKMVSRAELKLQGAVEAFSYDFRGKIVLDIGSSTGGFTELVLRQGAEKVIAVEIGTRQMKAPLRYDPKVELHEKTDFLTIHSGLGRTDGAEVEIDLSGVEMVVADVSFVSLRKILAHAQKIVPQKADYLVMLKPQFEARAGQLNRGVVKNEKIRREIIREFDEWLKRKGFVVMKKRDNEVRGKVGGNRERFYWLRAV